MTDLSSNQDDLPSSWLHTQLGRVVNYGRTTKVEPSDIPGDAWVLELEDIEKDSSRILQRMTFSQRQSKSTKNKFLAGDVLYGKLRPYLNKVVIADKPGYCTTEIVPIQAGLLDNRFLFYWLKHPTFLKYVEAESHGLNMPRLGTDTGNAAPFVLAPREEQTRIADQLDTLLTRINACHHRLDAIPALLKRFRKAVLDAAMSGALTDALSQSRLQAVDAACVVATRLGAEVGSAKNKVSEFLLNHQPKPAGPNMPYGWLKTHVGVVGKVSNGSTPSRGIQEYWKGTIAWVSSGEVANNEISSTKESITEAGFQNSSVRLLPAGTVLLAMIGEGKTRGQSSLLNIPACINQNIAGVVPVREVIEPKFLWYWFQRQYEATRTVGNGSGPKALNCERVRELEVFLPPINEQMEIVLRIEALFKFADNIEARHTAAVRQAQRLSPLTLAKAFRGELVQQNPQDEPASILLQRIAGKQPEKLKTTRGRPRLKKPETVEVPPVALPDWSTLPVGAWAAQVPADEHTATAQLTAVLKAWGKPMPQDTARLATLMCLQPRLLTTALRAEHATQWRRLVGDAAAPLPAQVVTLQPAFNTPWRNAISKMRARGDLVETGSGAQGTWALGPDAARVDTAGWPKGRASWVVHYLQTHGVEAVLPTLATEVQEFVHAHAA